MAVIALVFKIQNKTGYVGVGDPIHGANQGVLLDQSNFSTDTNNALFYSTIDFDGFTTGTIYPGNTFIISTSTWNSIKPTLQTDSRIKPEYFDIVGTFYTDESTVGSITKTEVTDRFSKVTRIPTTAEPFENYFESVSSEAVTQDNWYEHSFGFYPTNLIIDNTNSSSVNIEYSYDGSSVGGVLDKGGTKSIGKVTGLPSKFYTRGKGNPASANLTYTIEALK